MDTLPDEEFMSIFDRVTEYMSLKGDFTADEIDATMKRREKMMKEARKLTESEGVRKRLTRAMTHLRTLRVSGHPTFAEKVITVASENPKGRVALTLQYGKKRAKEILLSRHRARLLLKRKKEKQRIRGGA